VLRVACCELRVVEITKRCSVCVARFTEKADGLRILNPVTTLHNTNSFLILVGFEKRYPINTVVENDDLIRYI
jgi:hypothetical protein